MYRWLILLLTLLLKLPGQTITMWSDNELLGTSVASDVPIQCELLCFVVNKIQTMPYEFISKLCTDFYNEEAVETAKDILFETAFTANADKKPRKIKRRGAGNKQNDLHDILNVCL